MAFSVVVVIVQPQLLNTPFSLTNFRAFKQVKQTHLSSLLDTKKAEKHGGG